MAVLRMFADLLEECHVGRKNGALFVAVATRSDNLIRFYLKDGEVCSLSYGPVKDRECLEMIECYDLGKVVYFEGLKAPNVSMNLPRTEEIIRRIRTTGKRVRLD